MTAKRINLLPPELKQRRRARTTAAALGIGGLALVGLLTVVYGVQEIRLRAERGTLETQEERNADLQAQVAELREFDVLEAELERKIGLLDDVTAAEVRWSVILADVSLVIPSDVWLTSFTGTVQSSPDAEEEAATPGSIQMSGTTFSHPDVARWLTRLGQVDTFVFPYLSLSAIEQIEEIEVVNFNSSVDLSPQAFRRNQRGAQRRI